MVSRMVMSDSEILSLYRESKDQKKQVKILAELNGVPLFKMEKKLKDLGIDVDSDEAPLFDAGEALCLFEEGLSDKDIAAKLHIRLQTFCTWKRTQGLVRKRNPRHYPELTNESTCQNPISTSAQIPAGLISKMLSIFPESMQPVLDMRLTGQTVQIINVCMEIRDGQAVNGIIKIR